MTVAAVAMVLWALLLVSVVGVFYALFFGVFFFVSHLAFVAHLRGSGVRLGPDQFPEIHAKIKDLARAMDMEPPEAYLMQAGGALNAFATRFLGRNIMVLYSDLLEACGENEGARDMIIAHELGHLRCGHLRWLWFTLPGHFVPFLGSALSRAREYTCDRFGAAGAGSPRDAALGLAILSAGPRFGPVVNLRTFVSQRADTNTGFMTIGEWFGSHPPLSKRIAAIDPSLAAGRFHPTRGRLMALVILSVVVLAGVGATGAAAFYGSELMGSLEDMANLPQDPAGVADPEEAETQVRADFQSLATFIAEAWPTEELPQSMAEIREQWATMRDTPFPLDPFDGYEYGYETTKDGYLLWSSGRDGSPGTEDDILVER